MGNDLPNRAHTYPRQAWGMPGLASLPPRKRVYILAQQDAGARLSELACEGRTGLSRTQRGSLANDYADRCVEAFDQTGQPYVWVSLVRWTSWCEQFNTYQ